MINVDEIKARLESAAYVMRLLPSVRAQGYAKVRWDVVYTPREISGMDRRPQKPQPTQEQVTRMEEALGWLDILEPWERKLVWKRAERIPWKVLCWEFGYHRSKLTEKYNVALAKIQGSLR